MIVLQPIINMIGSPWFLFGSICSAALISYKSPQQRAFQLTYILIVTNLSLLFNLMGWVVKK